MSLKPADSAQRFPYQGEPETFLVAGLVLGYENACQRGATAELVPAVHTVGLLVLARGGVITLCVPDAFPTEKAVDGEIARIFLYDSDRDDLRWSAPNRLLATAGIEGDILMLGPSPR